MVPIFTYDFIGFGMAFKVGWKEFLKRGKSIQKSVLESLLKSVLEKGVRTMENGVGLFVYWCRQYVIVFTFKKWHAVKGYRRRSTCKEMLSVDT